MKKHLLPLLLMIAVSPSISASETQTLFLENGVIRLGVDLASGGAIFHFSRDGGSNLLNHYDRGRLIQQSFYGDPDDSRWVENPWRWNPVQGGDYRGKSAVVEESRLEENLLYIRTTPLHWASGAEIPEARMEQWIRLEGPVVRIRYRLRYTGAHAHRPHHQEMPAVFVDAAHHTLVFYRGDQPWTGGPLTRISPGWPNEYHDRTEDWSAFVDDNDNGIGVFTPGTQRITAYTYPGNSGPKGNACAYFAPIRTLAITPELVLTYDVFLTLGSVEEIRDRFRELHSRRPQQ